MSGPDPVPDSDRPRPVVIVTGGAGGIGRAVSAALVAAGSRVVVADIGVTIRGLRPDPTLVHRVVAELSDSGGTAVAHVGSVAGHRGAQALVRATLRRFGRVDGLVTCHGIFRDGSVVDATPTTWDLMIDNHLTGTFACVQQVARQMQAQGSGGSMVCVTSSSGLEGNPTMAPYAAAKAGVLAVVKSAALHLAADGISVNGLIANARTRVTTRSASTSGQWWGRSSPNSRLAGETAVALLGGELRDVTGQAFMTTGTRLSLWSQPTETAAETRPDWDHDQVVRSVRTSLRPVPLRRFDIYGTRPPECLPAPSTSSAPKVSRPLAGA